MKIYILQIGVIAEKVAMNLYYLSRDSAEKASKEIEKIAPHQTVKKIIETSTED